MHTLLFKIIFLCCLFFVGYAQVDPVYNYLMWSDEFDYSGAVDSAKWFHQTALPIPGSWYNGEIQHYTNRTDNASVSNGTLKIVAKKETFNDQGFTKQYTSARLNSKFAFKYGRFICRAKLPTGVGTWPAIWTLGKNIDENGAYWDNLGFGTTLWPACGEIDIMEHWGNNQNYVQSAVHSPSSFGATTNFGGRTIQTASSDFHVYALEWSPNKVVFSIDSIVHYTYQPATKNAATWPFDAEQYILLNVAIQPSIGSGFTQSALEVDYIRIYQENLTSVTTLTKSKEDVFYPNPVNDELNIDLEDSNIPNIFVKIHSVDNKLLKADVLEVNHQKVRLLNLDELPKGIYHVSYEVNGNYRSFKISKN